MMVMMIEDQLDCEVMVNMAWILHTRGDVTMVAV